MPQDRDEIQALNDSDAMGVDVVYLTVLVDGPTMGVASTRTDATNWANHFGLTSPVLSTANDANETAEQQHLSYSIATGEPEAVYPTSIFIRPDGTIFSVRIGLKPEGDTTERFLGDLP